MQLSSTNILTSVTSELQPLLKRRFNEAFNCQGRKHQKRSWHHRFSVSTKIFHTWDGRHDPGAEQLPCPIRIISYEICGSASMGVQSTLGKVVTKSRAFTDKVNDCCGDGFEGLLPGIPTNKLRNIHNSSTSISYLIRHSIAFEKGINEEIHDDTTLLPSIENFNQSESSWDLLAVS